MQPGLRGSFPAQQADRSPLGRGADCRPTWLLRARWPLPPHLDFPLPVVTAPASVQGWASLPSAPCPRPALPFLSPGAHPLQVPKLGTSKLACGAAFCWSLMRGPDPSSSLWLSCKEQQCQTEGQRGSSAGLQGWHWELSGSLDTLRGTSRAMSLMSPQPNEGCIVT